MHDHYTTLGIKRGAGIDRIKAAYRKAVKDSHPDLGRCRDNDDEFLKTQEAYEVLSDTERRKAYDRDLDRRETTVPVTHSHGSGIRRTADRFDQYTSQLDPFRSRFGAFFGGTAHEFFRADFGRETELFLEIELTPEEAASGCPFPLSIPLVGTCSQCRGTGYAGFSHCPACLGTGRIETERRISLSIPAGVYDGLETRVPLERLGLAGRYIDAVIRIRGHRYR